MKKFGFGRKKESSGTDVNPYAAQSDSSPQASQSVDNPYANQSGVQDYGSSVPSARPGPAPAAGRFQPSGRVGLPGGPRVGGGGLPSGPGPRNGSYGAPPPPYSGTPSNTAYDSEKYSASSDYGGSGYSKDMTSGGYGGNGYSQNNAAFAANQSRAPPAGGQSYAPYGSRPSPQPQYNNSPSFGPQTTLQGSDRSGGYGGMGSADPNSRDLFTGVDRQQPPPRGDYSSQASSSTTMNQSFQGYGEQRELTEEELEQESLRNTKAEIAQLRGEGVNSINRSLAIGREMLLTGNATKERLASQGERLQNSEVNVSRALIQNREAAEGVRELKGASNMIQPMKNPFNKNRRKAEEDRRKLELAEADRRNGESLRAQHRNEAANRYNGGAARVFGSDQGPLGWKKIDEGHSAKYLEFHDDDEPGEAESRAEAIAGEEAIMNGLDELSQIVSMGRQNAVDMGNEIDAQNRIIDRVSEKSDLVATGINKNRIGMDRIR